MIRVFGRWVEVQARYRIFPRPHLFTSATLSGLFHARPEPPKFPNRPQKAKIPRARKGAKEQERKGRGEERRGEALVGLVPEVIVVASFLFLIPLPRTHIT